MDSLVVPKPTAISKEPETVTAGLGLETEISLDKKAPRPVHRSKLSKKEQAAIDQDEFNFIDADAQRGYFEKTDRNEYKDEDLDVPTFMRRGIKIKIK
jgi:cell division protein FtsZ